MSKIDVAKIAAAVRKNRGGWEHATGAEILRLWQTLDEATQAAYLASLEAPPAVMKPKP